MANHEGEAVLEWIELKHTVEAREYGAVEENLKVQGSTTLEHRDKLNNRLSDSGFGPAEHLKQIAQGKVNAIWAFGLFMLNTALMLFVFMAFGRTPITVVLSFLFTTGWAGCCSAGCQHKVSDQLR